MCSMRTNKYVLVVSILVLMELLREFSIYLKRLAVHRLVSILVLMELLREFTNDSPR